MGKHSLKFGGEWAHIEADTDIPDQGRGEISFLEGGIPTSVSAAFTCPPSFGSGSCSSRTRFLGNSEWWKVYPRRPKPHEISDMAAFAQDDWRLTPRFTINLGLRYTYESPLREANNLLGQLRSDVTDGIGSAGGNRGTLPCGIPIVATSRPVWALPGIVNGKGTTVVRGGFSIIYSTFTMIEWMNQHQISKHFVNFSLGANPTQRACTVNGACREHVRWFNRCWSLRCKSLSRLRDSKIAAYAADPAVASFGVCPARPTKCFRRVRR